jgi:hypothetical protein
VHESSCDSGHKDVDGLPTPGYGPEALISLLYKTKQSQQRCGGAAGISVQSAIEGCYLRTKRLDDNAVVFFVFAWC